MAVNQCFIWFKMKEFPAHINIELDSNNKN